MGLLSQSKAGSRRSAECQGRGVLLTEQLETSHIKGENLGSLHFQAQFKGLRMISSWSLILEKLNKTLIALNHSRAGKKTQS